MHLESTPGPTDVLVARPDNQRQYCKIPNALLRSALFAVKGKGQRTILSEAQINGQAGTGITYTGEQLDQRDLDLWSRLVDLLYKKPRDQEFAISWYAILRILAITDTGPNRIILRNRMQRLSSCKLSVDNPWCKFTGSLIKMRYVDGSNLIALRLDPKVNELFDNKHYTIIHWELRSSLSGHPLSQWLHGYYATHAKPHPVSIETLKKMSGSNTLSLGKFRQLLSKALDKVATTSREHGQQFEFKIDGKLVTVNKCPTRSQQRYLQKTTVAEGKD